jgi:hypothetical protein
MHCQRSAGNCDASVALPTVVAPRDALDGRRIDSELGRKLTYAEAFRLTQRGPYGDFFLRWDREPAKGQGSCPPRRGLRLQADHGVA